MKDLPPNAEAEFWLLGCVFRDPRIMAQFSHALEPNDFLLEKHRLIWQAFQTLQKDGRDIDIVTVISEIEKTGMLKSAFSGDKGYIYDIYENSVPSAASADYYVDLVAKASALRKLIAALQTTLGEAKAPDAEAESLASAIIERASEIAKKSARAETEHATIPYQRTLDSIKEARRQGKPLGLRTGFKNLDALTSGLRRGEVLIVGARTGMGKTSFALSLALNLAKETPVLFFSLEMAEEQLTARIMSVLGRVNLRRTMDANITEEEVLNIEAAKENLKKRGLYMEFKAGMSISEICAIMHAFHVKHASAVVVIDHLHYIRTAPNGKYENRNIEIGKITHTIKELAKSLHTRIILLSQLNREGVKEATKGKNPDVKSPNLTDLRDSGNIEQDADMVWFIHRPGYYNLAQDSSETEIKVAKSRSGPTGIVNMHFNKDTTEFSETQSSQSTYWNK